MSEHRPRAESSRDFDGVRREHPLPRPYRRAVQLAESGRVEDARKAYKRLAGSANVSRFLALVTNDLGTLAAIDGDYGEAFRSWHEAIALDATCEPPKKNLELLRAELAEAEFKFVEDPRRGVADELSAKPGVLDQEPVSSEENGFPQQDGGSRVAILSFLFNWPSTGGGIVHTVELARFLVRAGHEVRIIHTRFSEWGLGKVEAEVGVPSDAIAFDESSWNVAEIRARFRAAVDAFGPDHVLITDSWNMKPHLAEAVRGYPYLLRFQALECFCPLNNLRLLATGPDDVWQCRRNQLATPGDCLRCLDERGSYSGPLHHLERALAGVGAPEYDRTLRRALEEAEAVLVLNPLTEAMVEPYAKEVRVVPWGMDPSRFPWPPPDEAANTAETQVVRLFMASVAGEFIKGYHILHEACERLRQSRDDFELLVTFDPSGPIDAFTRSVGWASQEDLPRHYRAADICVVPTIAQEGLSRTSVEAMASGLPVVASRIGGLPSTVTDGVTGLLFEPGNVDDLARKLATLLDDPELRRRMGLAGRKRFEEDFTWDVVVERYYQPLLAKR